MCMRCVLILIIPQAEFIKHKIFSFYAFWFFSHFDGVVCVCVFFFISLPKMCLVSRVLRVMCVYIYIYIWNALHSCC